MSYKNLDIGKMAREIVVKIHRMTLTNLPKFEMYEEGGQIRRSSKSVKSTIVEGYGRSQELDILGKKLNLFIQSVEKGHLSRR